jgi:AcrR family transcriptional regulator
MSITKPRLRRSPEAAREHILAAAEAILVESGPQQLKLTDVAAAAGVVHATVLHHFGSIAGLQTALMTRMVHGLAERIVAITSEAGDPHRTAEDSIQALFDAFGGRSAARLAAWLELTGEAERLSVVRSALQQVVATRIARFGAPAPEVLEDFMLGAIAIALGAGLFGPTLGALTGKPESRARDMALAMIRLFVEQTLLVPG